jgi:hypothetical protein
MLFGERFVEVVQRTSTSYNQFVGTGSVKTDSSPKAILSLHKTDI